MSFQKPFIAHYVAELEGVDEKILNDADHFMQTMLDLAKELHLNLADQPHIHRFEPYGLSLVFILSESHLAAHTWPEKNFMNVDLQICSPHIDLTQFEPLLKEKFQPKEIHCKPLEY